MEGKPIWIWAAAAVFALMVVGKVVASSGPGTGTNPPVTPGPSATLTVPAGAISISIANSLGKAAWMDESVRKFNEASAHDGAWQLDGKPIFVQVVMETIEGRPSHYRSGTMVSDTLSGKIKPTILSPADEIAILRLQKDWQGLNRTTIARDTGLALARTPLVLAMWQSRATALGCWPNPGPDCTWERIRGVASSSDGWGETGHSDWGKLKLGYGYLGEDSPGTSSMVVVCMLGTGKTSGLTMADVDVDSGCGEAVATIERAKVHSGVTSTWLLGQLTGGGPEYLDGVIIYESDVIGFNRSRTQELREPVVSVYPQDGTMLVPHPFTVLEGAPWVTAEQVAAARVFQRFLLADEQQRAVLAAGLRPADTRVPLSAPIDPSLGANPAARIATVDIPDQLVLDRIGEVWHRVKKHATVALVFDKSGSMSGQKIGAAIKGAEAFVQRMDLDDQLVWRPFDSRVYPPAQGSREELMSRIGSTSAGGETALYDAVLAAAQQLNELRATSEETRRYGIVVLSDGQDTNSRNSLAMLEAQLKPQESDPFGIQIHTIAIGSDADEAVLKKIANATHGRFWKGQTPSEMVAVYAAIATYY